MIGDPDNGGSALQSDTEEILVPLDLDLIPLDEELSFPVFVRSNSGSQEEYILIGNPGIVLSERVRAQVHQLKSSVYTKEKYRKAYEDTLEAHFEQILTNESIALEKRVTVLYDRGETIMKDFFNHPDSSDAHEKTQELVKHIVRVTLTNDQSTHTLMKIARRDYETYTHSMHVCILGVFFSQYILSQPEILRKYQITENLEKLGQGFMYHDLGKSLIDPRILKKPGALDPVERDEIQKHPLDGVQLLEEIGVRNREILHITLYHHERFNGDGYPYGLIGQQIAPISRVAAIVDAFDAITSHRSYKKAVSTFQALNIMKNENQGFYDPELFEHFVRLLGLVRNPLESGNI